MSKNDAPQRPRLPDRAQRTLDEIADALNITTALLHQDAQSELLRSGPVSLMEASKLLQTYIRIQDPEARQRCLAFVQEEAARGGGGA
ncbi:hypothetical protein [Methylobacterium sp. CCH5-D2]|uniref:hypothetical protein n=1 Tax=Methylobacterium sp. CCH5-D2 TaxID=1768765 RepID=UPI0012E3D3C0|nr:hypothetical protein [Methylobacterium sp. CCH5-D2]